MDRQRQLERVARSLGVDADVFAALADAQSADLRSVLLNVVAADVTEIVGNGDR